MAARNTAKYGSELARLLGALASTPESILKTQGTLVDILDKVSDLHPKFNSIPLCQFTEDCGHDAIINMVSVLKTDRDQCTREFHIAVIRALRIVNGMRKLRADHWQSLPYQETMLSVLVQGLRSEDEMIRLYSAATLAGVTMHYSEFTRYNIPELLMKMYMCDGDNKLELIQAVGVDHLHPTSTTAAAAHTIMKFYQSKTFYQRICDAGFIKRTMEIVVNHDKYEDDLVFCVIRYFLFSTLIHSRPEMKAVEKELGVDFFSKVLVDIGEKFECRNEQMQEIVRSSSKVVSAQALKFGHMLTPEAGNTQWMEEHEEEACSLLRKPLDIKRKCSSGECKNLESEIGQYDRCSGCKVTVYCAAACQKAHWAEKHKKMCKRLRKWYTVKTVTENADLD